jgi:hypothetical protein
MTRERGGERVRGRTVSPLPTRGTLLELLDAVGGAAAVRARPVPLVR